MEAPISFEILVPIYRTRGRHVSENRKRNVRPIENLTFPVLAFIVWARDSVFC
jgi:hypothetical protein